MERSRSPCFELNHREQPLGTSQAKVVGNKFVDSEYLACLVSIDEDKTGDRWIIGKMCQYLRFQISNCRANKQTMRPTDCKYVHRLSSATIFQQFQHRSRMKRAFGSFPTLFLQLTSLMLSHYPHYIGLPAPNEFWNPRLKVVAHLCPCNQVLTTRCWLFCSQFTHLS